MAERIRKNAEGEEYRDWYHSVEDLQDRTRRYRLTPAQARKRIEEIQHLLARLLDPKLSDARRAVTVTMLKKRLCLGYNQVEDLGALGKIACGSVDPTTLTYVEPT